MLKPVKSDEVRLCFCGDLMTGRGLDQILPHPSSPELYEPWVRDARDYVELAEQRSGHIDMPVTFAYCWGAALDELREFAPHFRIANLETSVTRCNDYWPGKGINYRMHPGNVLLLTAAGIDICSLANNHVLDWGYAGLTETVSCLSKAGITLAGAGINLAQAQAAASLPLSQGGRLVFFGVGMGNSGIPESWAATENRAGVWRADEADFGAVIGYAEALHELLEPGDILVCSIHWGGNWGYTIAPWRQELAHQLVDAGVDIVHGHSSHHPLGVECYRDRLILYGCGDLLNDYEGIEGHEAFRSELRLLYLVRFDRQQQRLQELSMVPLRITRMQLVRADSEESAWLQQQLDRESQRFGNRVQLGQDGRLYLQWD